MLIKCEGVVLYRSSPAQKAQVVELMRKFDPSKKTLAVGDGINDVAMIQKAHVGVGIMGREGNQASAFADYAVPRFKDMRRLIFWHGSAFASKLSNAVLWCVFKASIYGTSVWFFNHWNGFSGHHTVDSLLWGMYSVVMTNFALGFYIVHEAEIPFTASFDEEKLPYKLSGFYKMCRTEMKRFYTRYTLCFLWAWVISYLQCAIYFGVMAESGGIIGG